MHHAMPHYGAKMKENFGVSACRCAALLSSCMEARVVTILSLGRWCRGGYVRYLKLRYLQVRYRYPTCTYSPTCRLQERLLLSCSSLRDSLIMEVAIARLPLRFSFQYLPYLVFPPGANVHPNRYFSPTGTCNLSLRWPGTLSISASSQLEVLQ